MRAIVLAILVVAPAAMAQPKPPPKPARCEPCDRGDAVITRYGLEVIRSQSSYLAQLELDEPLSPAEYETIVSSRARTPGLGRVGVLDDAEIADVAATICRNAEPCLSNVARALTCLADRCEVQLPVDRRVDVIRPEPECRRTTRKRSTPIGIGVDVGTGWDRSRFPNDGRTWSLGLAGRLALGPRYGLVARADHFAGRDEATDMDGNGEDDVATGSVTRFSALAGPSFVLDSTRYERTTRSLRLDLLGGFIATSSQPGEDGVAAGFDLAFQLAGLRTGVRVIQGFGEASSATMAVAHLGIAVGSVPPHTDEKKCSSDTRSTRLALGFELPLGGYGMSSQLGYLATGFGMELMWHLSRRIDLGAHADLIVYPGNDRERVIHQAVLGGVRFDHGGKGERRKRTGFYSTMMAGYTHGAALADTTAGTGPIGDLSVAWGAQDSDFAGYLRLHGRFGISPDNADYRAVFLSMGFELRFDPRRWADRERSY